MLMFKQKETPTTPLMKVIIDMMKTFIVVLVGKEQLLVTEKNVKELLADTERFYRFKFYWKNNGILRAATISMGSDEIQIPNRIKFALNNDYKGIQTNTDLLQYDETVHAVVWNSADRTKCMIVKYREDFMKNLVLKYGQDKKMIWERVEDISEDDFNEINKFLEDNSELSRLIPTHYKGYHKNVDLELSATHIPTTNVELYMSIGMQDFNICYNENSDTVRYWWH